MKKNKHKYQEEYENTAGLFWDNKPAKYVRLFTEEVQSNLSNWKILDLGAGEGKNAVFLAGLGGKITAVDLSAVALSKFHLQPNYNRDKNNINIVNCNVLGVAFDELSFDLIVAYGILHCLSNKEEIKQFVRQLKKWGKIGSYFIGATFTDAIPPPDIQEYLDFEAFLSTGEFEELFGDWSIIYSEDAIITESHPTSGLSHQHSITRLIAKKI
jgi:tellurite methyltransferase